MQIISRTYTQIDTPTHTPTHTPTLVGGGGGGWNPFPEFDMLQYFETVLLLEKNL